MWKMLLLNLHIIEPWICTRLHTKTCLLFYGFVSLPAVTKRLRKEEIVNKRGLRVFTLTDCLHLLLEQILSKGMWRLENDWWNCNCKMIDKWTLPVSPSDTCTISSWDCVEAVSRFPQMSHEYSKLNATVGVIVDGWNKYKSYFLCNLLC